MPGGAMSKWPAPRVVSWIVPIRPFMAAIRVCHLELACSASVLFEGSSADVVGALLGEIRPEYLGPVAAARPELDHGHLRA